MKIFSFEAFFEFLKKVDRENLRAKELFEKFNKYQQLEKILKHIDINLN